MRENTLYNIHVALCHPGITRLNHYVQANNLPYSLDDVRKVVHNCTVCAEVRPNFYKPPDAQLVKATQPFERLSLDFIGPLPSSTKNHYMLTVVDEYLHFPFAFPCRSIDAETVLSCLNQLFMLFEMPAYIHSDRGSAFVSHDLISYLHHRGIGCSKTSIYNPRGNGQCERYTRIIWSSVKLALKSRKVHISQWELVLPDVLHSIRSLLCTTTNEALHERLSKQKRRLSFGVSVPTWLSPPGRVYLRRRATPSKYDPVVEEVDLVHATPSYACVRFPTCVRFLTDTESAVSLRDIAPSRQSITFSPDGSGTS